jgi:hypothetical protein
MRYETYITSKRIVNEEIKDIINEKTENRNTKTEGFMMLLIAITKLIINKQEIVYKDKKKQRITNQFTEKELNNMVKKGVFRIFETPTSTKRKSIQEKKIRILDIKEDKIDDSGWIIDNIRDSLAHNKYKINYEKQAIEIENTLEERKLICEIDFYWLIRFSFILSNNRIENKSRKLKLAPYIYPDDTEYEYSIQNEKEINKLINELRTIMVEIELKDNIPEEILFAVKNKINNLWNKEVSIKPKTKEEELETLERIINGENTEIPLIEKELRKRLEKIKKDTSNIWIIKPNVEELEQYVQNSIKTIKTFRFLNPSIQYKIIKKIIAKKLFNHDNTTTIIEDGLDAIMNIDFGNNNDLANKNYINNEEQRITDYLSCKEEKLLASLYLLGTTTFTLYKEQIFDKQINYDEIDLSNFEKMDIRTPIIIENDLETQILQLLDKLKIQKKILNQINKLQKNLEKCPEKISIEITKQKEKLKNSQKEIKYIQNRLSELNKNKKNIKEANEIRYIEVNNKEFMRHLRNALAHTWIEFGEQTEEPLERKVIIKDYNDNNELVYISTAKYKDWIDLFNNKKFEESLKTYSEEQNEHIYTL